MSVGLGTTRLIVVRGNSGSGKSAVAQGVRDRYGRGVAVVGQDNVRRVILRERDVPGGANIGLIDAVARYALDAGYHVVVEGILYADRYGDMLRALREDHRGRSRFFYLDVPFEETLRRHATKPQAEEYGKREMREWYRRRDLLDGGVEQVIGVESGLEGTIGRVMAVLSTCPGPSGD